jgi:hypothetical protein
LQAFVTLSDVAGLQVQGGCNITRFESFFIHNLTLFVLQKKIRDTVKESMEPPAQVKTLCGNLPVEVE